MPIARYLSHPQVLINPDKDVPKWSLNEIGQARVRQLTERITKDGILSDTKYVISSNETKALETAEPIVDILGCTLTICPLMHENDRNSTGFLKPDEFERVADQFFATPDVSARGWETAQHAQTRILQQVNESLSSHKHDDVLFVGHGGVGTLLYCALSGNEIHRKFDQGAANTGAVGGGNYFAFDINTKKPLHGWHAMEEMK
jgi:broad specificity phosphatase PhoE